MIDIRKADSIDAYDLLQIYKPYVEKTTSTFKYDTPSLDEFQSKIEETLKRYPFIVAEDGDEIIGYAYAHQFNTRSAYDWTLEISVYVSSNSRGKGTGKLLYSEIESILMKQNVVNIIASITGENESSKRFHNTIGYDLVVGFKSDKWLDNFWMLKKLYDGQNLKSLFFFLC
ncbi:N-acetyltransferase family protein [Leuconostoc citreum]